MTEKEARENIKNTNERAIRDACRAIKGYNEALLKYMAEIVASLCNISVADMLRDTKNQTFAQARWLYWYAIKQMLNVSNDHISNLNRGYHKFLTASVTNGISNMSMMIVEQPVWRKRWDMLKRIIKSANEVEDDSMFNQTVKLKIKSPKGINVELTKE